MGLEEGANFMAVAALLGIVLILGPAVVTRLVNNDETSASAHSPADPPQSIDPNVVGPAQLSGNTSG
jgi:hypothetical protein